MDWWLVFKWTVIAVVTVAAVLGIWIVLTAQKAFDEWAAMDKKEDDE